MAALGLQGWAWPGYGELGVYWRFLFWKAVRAQQAWGVKDLGGSHGVQVPRSSEGGRGAQDRAATPRTGSFLTEKPWKTFINNYYTKPTEQSV